MAQSPAHRLGQIIGDQLEAAIKQPLQEIADEFGLYLDFKHSRPARGRRKKVVWTDSFGNTHDLDYVLEEHGSELIQGQPRAFIETAWRRYTKHSKNKAQEIQAAIGPLALTYEKRRPFLGVVLGGEFTEPSLVQFRSNHFHLAHLPYRTVIDAFRSAGVDVSSEEDTPESLLRQKVEAFERLNVWQKQGIQRKIREHHADRLSLFFDALRSSLDRYVRYIIIHPLFGSSHQCMSVTEAIALVSADDQRQGSDQFVRYEILVHYSNQDEIRGRFNDRRGAIQFLQSL